MIWFGKKSYLASLQKVRLLQGVIEQLSKELRKFEVRVGHLQDAVRALHTAQNKLATRFMELERTKKG